MADNEERRKWIHRLPPCPAYDVEGMESWLESMAQDGCVLCEDGFFADVASFEKTTPQKRRYRLTASENGEGEDEEKSELSEACGWKYIAKRGKFCIYTSDDPMAVEFDTDPAVQALAIDMIRKRGAGALSTAIIWIAINVVARSYEAIFRSMIGIGTWFWLFGTAIFLWAGIDSLIEAIHLRRLVKKLRSGEELDRKKDWQRHAKRNRIVPIVYIALVLVFVGIALKFWNDDVLDVNEQPLQSYTEELPFATMETLVPGSSFVYSNYDFSNTIEVKSDWLAPQVIDFSQNGTITMPDGSTLSGGLMVQYYRTAAPWIAQELAKEYQRSDKRQYKKHYSEYELPDLGMDYAAA